MPTSNPDLARRRAAIARARRVGDPDAEARARSDYYAEKLAATIAAIVATAPPLTTEQHDRLALLLRDGAA